MNIVLTRALDNVPGLARDRRGKNLMRIDEQKIYTPNRSQVRCLFESLLSTNLRLSQEANRRYEQEAL